MVKEPTELKLRTIHSLLGEHFLIPSYQRGYRWKPKQVEQLLDDIWEFSRKRNKSEREFYCLQPIVVRRHESGNWEIIDGQQRLTTLRIILTYIVREHLRRPLQDAFGAREFVIRYETRTDSNHFLENINEDDSNLDYLHMWVAFKKVESWFSTKLYDEHDDFIKTLLARDEKNPVQVIWYEVMDATDPIDIFTRLNIGKIPLTNSELIKALFLGKANSNNNEQKENSVQLRIAAEWDMIENTLQNDAFWFFIYDKNNKHLPHHTYETRIEYVFDLMEGKGAKEEDEYFTFIKFLKKFKSKADSTMELEDIWLNIKRFFQILEEWYLDHEYYHLIGYLVATGNDLKEIISKVQEKSLTKSMFRKLLRKEISNGFNKIQLDDLAYESHGEVIRRILLLANVQTILANQHTKSRFPFESYKKEKNWDIEHIRSQSEVDLKGEARQEWAKLVLEYFTGITWDKNTVQQKEAIYQLEKEKRDSCFLLIKTIEGNCGNEEFKSLFGSLKEVFGEDKIPEDGGLENLALLDAGTNRGYKNAFFAVKRMVIIKLEKNGFFVPICTKNVFMKAYSRRFDNIMYWTETDSKDYLSSLKELLEPYFPNQIEKQDAIV